AANDDKHAGTLGRPALIGLTFLKYDGDKERDLIKSALEKIVKETNGDDPKKFTKDIYSTGISILFLVAVDPSKYRSNIEFLAKSLHHRQKADGAWGYPESHKLGKTGDTSMTQYAALGLWEASDQAGVETPPEVWDRLGAWLIKTQDPSGGFGYQGKVSPSLDERVKQDAIGHAMVVAGLGSMFITKDQLGLSELKKRLNDDTPDALQPYETPQERLDRIKTQINPKYFEKALAAGARWTGKNFTIDKPKRGWLHYYLDALERYESLKEADKGGRINPSPSWYSQGARFLIAQQKEEPVDGSWKKGQAGPMADTCFAILFLLRSTKKSLEKSSLARFQASKQIGGRGLPDANDVRLRAGNVVVQPLAEVSPKEIADILSDPKHASHAQAREALADLASSGDRAALAESSSHFERLALRGPSDVRVLAIEAIARARNLNQVPLLIHLLNDPDLEVLRAARDALRVISRKFSGVGLGLRPSSDERATAISQWKQWYQTIRPDVDLESLASYDEAS
ncbi:MAG: hypothetical protein N2C14_28490, partial [Planctomycetales bacterium]